MPRANRVDPFGDLHAVSPRGMFTGNRGCLVDGGGNLVRHHRGRLWITCVLQFKDWTHPLAAPRTWTPLFFLDDAVALAAGHRPCGLCRLADYRSYRSAIAARIDRDSLTASDLDALLAAERLEKGRGLDRARDRKTWSSEAEALPPGTVALFDGRPQLVTRHSIQEFSFLGWGDPGSRPTGRVSVLTPPTSVMALANGFQPSLHATAAV